MEDNAMRTFPEKREYLKEYVRELMRCGHNTHTISIKIGYPETVAQMLIDEVKEEDGY